MKRVSALLLGGLIIMQHLHEVEAFAAEKSGDARNVPSREEWFQDLGIGMFIHWSMDSQIGSVISHSLVGSSPDYARRFFEDLPKRFEPRRFRPEDWARLANVAGMKYIMFTTKHHSGFCMFETGTTPFNVMNTPYKRDITGELVTAFRREGIPVGFYFSPEDFWVLHQQGRDIARKRDYAMPCNNPGLRDHNARQLRELFRNYDRIDLAFLDGFDNSLERDAIWAIDRNVVITRGVMATPEQRTPDQPMPGPWESCYTLGTQWHFKPTNEKYKSGQDLIRMLIEIRAKGGNFLLNVGPTPDGEIPFEQERRMRELGLWLFVNGEAVYKVRPWHVIREGDIWFTKAKDTDTLYAILPNGGKWKYGQRREFTIKSARATQETELAILGHNGRVLEYNPKADPAPCFEQKDDGQHLNVMRAQRLYNDKTWPNPIVAKLTNVEPLAGP